MCIKSWLRAGIAEYRLHNKASVADIARLLGTARSTIYQWLSYKYPNKIPTPKFVNKLVTILGLKPVTFRFKKQARHANQNFKKTGRFFNLNKAIAKYPEYLRISEKEAIRFSQKTAYVCWETIDKDFPASTSLRLECLGKPLLENFSEIKITPNLLPIVFKVLIKPGLKNIEYEFYWKLSNAAEFERIRYGVFCSAVILNLLKWINQLSKQYQKSKSIFDYDLFRAKIQNTQWV